VAEFGEEQAAISGEVEGLIRKKLESE